jgi:hypothetical protein
VLTPDPKRRSSGTDYYARPVGYRTVQRGLYRADGTRLGTATRERPRGQRMFWVVTLNGKKTYCDNLAEAAAYLDGGK